MAFFLMAAEEKKKKTLVLYIKALTIERKGFSLKL